MPKVNFAQDQHTQIIVVIMSVQFLCWGTSPVCSPTLDVHSSLLGNHGEPSSTATPRVGDQTCVPGTRHQLLYRSPNQDTGPAGLPEIQVGGTPRR